MIQSPTHANVMKRFLISLSVPVHVFALSKLPVFAAPAEDADSPSKLLSAGLDAAGKDAGYSSTLSLTALIGKIIGVVLGVIGIVFVIYLIIAGITYFTAAGEDTKVKKAKAMIRDSVIGIIIMVSAYAISSFVISQLVAVTK